MRLGAGTRAGRREEGSSFAAHSCWQSQCWLQPSPNEGTGSSTPCWLLPSSYVRQLWSLGNSLFFLICTVSIKCLRNPKSWAGEMAQCSLLEDPSSTPGTQVGQLTTNRILLQLRESNAVMWPLQLPIYTCPHRHLNNTSF